MAVKPEGRFIDKVHRHLPKSVYRQGMGLTATNGTPDMYYEGDRSILWVEYKWINKMPESIDLRHRKTSPKLSKLQQRWLRRATANHVRTAVILGSPEGAVIMLDDYWDMQQYFKREYLLNPTGVANYIEGIVT